MESVELTCRGTEPSLRDQAQPRVDGALTQRPLEATKRQHDGTSECDLLLAKRAMLSPTDPQGGGAEDKIPEQVDNV